jgi:nitroreductase/dihydropteridine reductase
VPNIANRHSQPWRFILIESEAGKVRFEQTFANKYKQNSHHATEASHIILFAHNPFYKRDDYKKILDVNIELGRLKQEAYEATLNSAFHFAELHSDENGCNQKWTKAQAYIALGNAMHVVARMGIDATPMEGIDSELIGEVFADELDGHVCDVALAIGYHAKEDFNHGLPKSRLALDAIFTTV